jgi:hypothetical protein
MAAAHEVVPSARRLIRSLRDMGYDFAAAVADLVDNSIEAKATLVSIDLEFDGDGSWVRISDNGHGMTAAQLREAMRYGADRSYAGDDLGKFGLGLKTASMSQCQRLSVASRVDSQRASISAYCWDLAHIEKTNRWEILPLERAGLGPPIRDSLKGGTGTVVLWERLDRILGYQHPYGEAARKRFLAMCRDLEQHLGMVFHRFLTGEARSHSLTINVNGNVVTPWDPFARVEPNTQVLHPVTLPVEHDGSTVGTVLIEPYVLPAQDRFTSPQAHSRAGGPNKWNRQQGFYIYRAGRMIQSGGWSGIRTLEEHLKLARISISFSPKLDDAFKINVTKMRVQLPHAIRESVERAIGPALRLANNSYRGRALDATTNKGPTRPTTTQDGHDAPRIPGALPAADADHGRPTSHEKEVRLWTLDDLAARLHSLASPTERPVILLVVERLRAHLSRQEPDTDAS